MVDWGPKPAPEELEARTHAALRDAPAPGSLGGWLPAEELVEARIVGAWLAGHDEASVVELDPASPRLASAA